MGAGGFVDLRLPGHAPRRQLASGTNQRLRGSGCHWPPLPCCGMAKASRVLAALKRDGWAETRRSGSHRVLVKGNRQRVWAYHDGVDLGGPAMARIAKDYGDSLDELRKL